MATRMILDDADAGTIVDGHMKGKVVPVWVRGGEAEVWHDGDVIVSLLPGQRKVIDGLSPGTGIQARAVVDGTTLMIDDG